jgi:hypothetical protein
MEQIIREQRNLIEHLRGVTALEAQKLKKERKEFEAHQLKEQKLLQKQRLVQMAELDKVAKHNEQEAASQQEKLDKRERVVEGLALGVEKMRAAAVQMRAAAVQKGKEMEATMEEMERDDLAGEKATEARITQLEESVVEEKKDLEAQRQGKQTKAQCGGACFRDKQETSCGGCEGAATRVEEAFARAAAS